MQPEQQPQHVQACVAQALSALDDIDLDNDTLNSLKVAGVSVPVARAAPSATDTSPAPTSEEPSPPPPVASGSPTDALPPSPTEPSPTSGQSP
jgi:hypothetical protein